MCHFNVKPFFRARLFDLIRAADSVVIDGCEIERIDYIDAGANPVFRCECDDDNEWSFADQDVKVSDGECHAEATTDDPDSDEPPRQVALTFAMRRPIELGDVNDALYAEVFIAAVPLVENEDLEEEDQDVPGVYSVVVPKILSIPDRASAALDFFHNSCAVGVLDDFLFCAYDPVTGIVMEESDGNESYSKTHLGRDFTVVTDELSDVFSVQVEAVEGREICDLGTVRVVANSKEEANERALAALWDSRLDAASCSPRYTTKLLVE